MEFRDRLDNSACVRRSGPFIRGGARGGGGGAGLVGGEGSHSGSTSGGGGVGVGGSGGDEGGWPAAAARAVGDGLERGWAR